jgi:hypothetical protein
MRWRFIFNVNQLYWFLVAILMIATGIVMVAFRQSSEGRQPEREVKVELQQNQRQTQMPLVRWRHGRRSPTLTAREAKSNPNGKRGEKTAPTSKQGIFTRIISQSSNPSANMNVKLSQHDRETTGRPILEGRIENITLKMGNLAKKLEWISNGRKSSATTGDYPKQRNNECTHGHFCRRQLLKGAMFTVARRKYQLTLHQTRTEVRTNLSYATQNSFRRMLHDPGHVTSYRATGAAILEQDGGFKLVQRIWDSSAEKRFLDNEPTLNTWPENYLFYQDLDGNYKPRSKGYILGIPTTTNCRFNNIKLYRTDGPMDPRLIRLNQSHVFLLFHVWKFAEVQDEENRNVEGHMFLWSFYDNSLLELDIPGFKLMTTEINWSPFVNDGQLYFIYSFDPLRVLRCGLEEKRAGKCNFVYVQQGAFEYNFNRNEDHLRGGTPLVLFEWPYYMTFTHSQFIDPIMEELSYKAHLAVVKVEPFIVVYLSQPILLSEDIYRGIPIVRHHLISNNFFFPIGLVLLDDDRADISVHINDYSGHVIRITGLRQIMNDVIETDRRQFNHIEPQSRMIQKALKTLLS